MTSKNQATECFVYITLPGQTEAVTAGRFVLSKSRDGTPLGKFVYGKSYLARNDAVEIDPLELKLSDETYETTRLRGVFGALRDAVLTSGDGGLSKSILAKRCSAKSTISWSCRTTAPARSVSGGPEPPPARRTSTRRWTW